MTVKNKKTFNLIKKGMITKKKQKKKLIKTEKN